MHEKNIGKVVLVWHDHEQTKNSIGIILGLIKRSHEPLYIILCGLNKLVGYEYKKCFFALEKDLFREKDWSAYQIILPFSEK